MKRTEPTNNTNERKLTEPISFRLYEDNFTYLELIAGPAERSEALRNIVDEAIRARLNPPADPGAGADIKPSHELVIEELRLVNGRYEELFKKYEQIAEREAKLKQGLISQLRVLAALIGEVLAAAIGARRLAWNYCAYESLKKAGNSDSQIKVRYEAEMRASNDERDETSKEVKRILAAKYGAPE